MQQMTLCKSLPSKAGLFQQPPNWSSCLQSHSFPVYLPQCDQRVHFILPLKPFKFLSLSWGQVHTSYNGIQGSSWPGPFRPLQLYLHLLPLGALVITGLLRYTLWASSAPGALYQGSSLLHGVFPLAAGATPSSLQIFVGTIFSFRNNFSPFIWLLFSGITSAPPLLPQPGLHTILCSPIMYYNFPKVCLSFWTESCTQKSRGS